MFEFFFHSRLPTSELYGLAGRFRSQWTRSACMGEIFRVGRGNVVVRCAPRPNGNRAGRCSVLVDDDIDSIIADPFMPAGYVERLEAAWAKSVLKTHPEEVGVVIVPSAYLESLYQSLGFQTLRMDPCWPVPTQPRPLQLNSDPFRVAFLGTRSHLADIELLRTALEEQRRKWEFHHFLGKHAPAWLSTLQRVVPHESRSWRHYKHSIVRQRFDLCVYPTLNTPVNQARSCNKIMEHAMTGAASLFSLQVPFRDRLGDLSKQLLVAGDDWVGAIHHLEEDRQACRYLALELHQLALDLSNKSADRQREIWEQLM